MKVLIVSPSIYRTKGGIATVVNKLLTSDHIQYGIKMEHLVTHVEGSILTRINHFAKSFFSLLFKADINLMHIHVASKGSFYRKSILTFLGRMKGIPIIIHVHGCDFDSFYANSSFLSRFLIRKTFNACYKVLVLSTYWHNYFVANITKDKANVELMFNGVDIPKNIEDFQNKIGNKNEFLFLGRLGQRKGVYDLLEAVNILVNHLKHDGLIFYLAGDGELDKVNNIILQYGLSQHVRVVGWLDDSGKSEYLERVTTVILPSYNEGLPMAILEAMAIGKVIISSKVGGIPELVIHNENGFLIDAGNVQEIVRSILRVAIDSKNLQQISKNNKEKIEKHYDLARLNKKLFEIYISAIESKND